MIDLIRDFMSYGHVWIICAAINYGFIFAHFQVAYPMLAERHWLQDRIFAVFIGAIGGPLGLCVTLLFGWHRH